MGVPTVGYSANGNWNVEKAHSSCTPDEISCWSLPLNSHHQPCKEEELTHVHTLRRLWVTRLSLPEAQARASRALLLQQ